MVGELYWLLPLVLALCGISVYIGWVMNSRVGQNKILSAEERAKQILDDAEKDIANLKKEKLLEVKDEWYKKKQDFERDSNKQRNKLNNFERQLSQREESINSKSDVIKQKEGNIRKQEEKLTAKEKDLESKVEEYQHILDEQNIRLEKISGMSRDEAKATLIDNMMNDAKLEAAQKLKEIRDEMKTTAKKEARRVILQAIQRTASDHSVETTVSVLNLQNDEMKGRIIGREGRNIRAFEAATGIDVIVDDTPKRLFFPDSIRSAVKWRVLHSKP